MARDGRRPGRWNDDRRTPRRRGLIDGDRVIGGVSGDAHERTLDRSEQIEGGGRIITRLLGQRVDTDPAGLIDAKVELPPATSAAATVFRGGPLTFPNDGQPRAVEHEMKALAGRDQPQAAPQMLTAPGERRIVGGGEVEAHHPEQRAQKPFGLAQREMVEEPQGQGGFDGEIRLPPLPAPLATPAGCPGGDRLRGHPHRHIAASNEGLIVGWPVRNVVLRLVPGMDLRLHPCSVAPAEGPEKCEPRRPTPTGYSCNNASHRRGERGSGCRPASSPRGTSSYTWDGPSTSPCSVDPAEGHEKCGPNRPTPTGYSCNNAVERRERLGELLSFYYREAARGGG